MGLSCQSAMTALRDHPHIKPSRQPAWGPNVYIQLHEGRILVLGRTVKPREWVPSLEDLTAEDWFFKKKGT